MFPERRDTIFVLQRTISAGASATPDFT